MTIEQEIAAVRAQALCVASADEVRDALTRMAAQIARQQLPGPVVLLCVMRSMRAVN